MPKLSGSSRFRCASLFLCAAPLAAHTGDSEWPPLKDPVDSTVQPAPGLQMGSISVALPSALTPWLNHQHIQDLGKPSEWIDYPLWFTCGDIEGPDDGDLDIVMYMPDEILFAARLDIDWTAGTGTLTPLWAWRDPKVATNPTPGSPMLTHAGPVGRNVVIWDIDGDNENEVAFTAQHPKGSGFQAGVYIVESSPTQPSSYGLPWPEPHKLASKVYDPPKPPGQPSGSLWLGPRIGVCDVSDGPYPELWTHGHEGTQLQIWKLTSLGGGTYSLDLAYQKDILTQNVAKTHEFNVVDFDGDGYDEFTLDGIVDFVNDVGGVATPINGIHGQQVWRSGISGSGENHIDQMICADFDPAHPGLEINSVPTYGFTSTTATVGPCDPGASSGVATTARDVMWTTNGCVLRTNANGPITGGQAMYIGNWTASRAGLETIYVPKSALYLPPGGHTLSRSYATDAQQNELALDGVMFMTQASDPLGIGQRAGAPANWMEQIDWDGDYASDEILNIAGRAIYVWRMGEKGDWGVNYPTWLPTQQQVGQGWPEGGQTQKWFWYENNTAWYWNNGGPGLYTHYYQKLGEAWQPNVCALKGYDLGRDYREEVVAVTPFDIDIHYNTAVLAAPWLHKSPRESKKYLQFRTEKVIAPFVYADQPIAQHIEVTPKTRGIDATTGSVQLTATLHYSDDSTLDVTSQVTWEDDGTQVVTLSSSGLATALGTSGSARITAKLESAATGVIRSEPVYVYASSSDTPAILLAGYEDSYLTSSYGLQPTLRVQARVAQRTNQPVFVWMEQPPNGSVWPCPQFVPSGYCALWDSGDIANHGDEVLGDGVYSNVIPYAGNPGFLSAGDHLKLIRAYLTTPPYVGSEPWPYVVDTATVTFPDIADNFANDPLGANATPRIAAAGFRGFSYTSGFAVLQVDALQPADTAFTLRDCIVSFHPTPSPAPTFPPVVNRINGTNTWVAIVPLAGLNAGTYLLDVYVYAKNDATNQVTVSDHWPRIRVH